MRLDDTIDIATPEGVEIELILAGLGSRLIAGSLDLTIQVALLFVVLFAFEDVAANGFVLALMIVLLFLVVFGYFVVFDLLNHGRTPGKAAVGLRAVRLDGGPVTFLNSTVRNLVRVVDGWFLLTLVLCPVGIVAVVGTKRNQRLGDLAAGTVVTRERFATEPNGLQRSAFHLEISQLTWDVTGVDDAEVAATRRFLERRYSIDPHARAHLGSQLASRLGPKVVGYEPTWPPEAFLEGLVGLKSARA